MSIIAGPLRAFWVPGLNAISGRVIKGLSGWVLDEEYQIYSPLQPDSFVLSVSAPEKLLSSYAADINRCSMASFESINSAAKIEALPRSTAWLVIKSYYAAFFAAHAISRILGTAFVQFERVHSNSVNSIATLFGMANTQNVSRGYYECTYDFSQKELSCKKAKSESGGVHEIFWGNIYHLVQNLSNSVISTSSGTASNNQQVSVKLSELAENLARGATGQGNWLSFIRNKVNYAHRFGTWFPYSEERAYLPRLFDHKEDWLSDPMSIDLTSYGDKDLLRFQATCNFFISLCRILVSDMAVRSSGKKSFHQYGSVALLNLMGLGKHLAIT
jgi:hypothetical protein